LPPCLLASTDAFSAAIRSMTLGDSGSSMVISSPSRLGPGDAEDGLPVFVVVALRVEIIS